VATYICNEAVGDWEMLGKPPHDRALIRGQLNCAIE